MAELSSRMTELLSAYEIGPADLDRIRAYGQAVRAKIGEAVQAFYVWLAGQPEFQEHFGNDAAKLARVKKLQEDYWYDFFDARLDDTYLERRRRVGEVHARVGLHLPVYFAAMSYFLAHLTERAYDGSLSAEEYSATVRAVTKMILLDTAVVVETYSLLTNKKITDQSHALIQMSTPVTAIWEDILMLPVVGLIDSRRAQDIRNATLAKIAETRARMFILDISGVAVVDTAVANHLIKIVKATKLMGCECTISGVKPAIAETMVELGIDVGNIQTTATLRHALEDAFRKTGVDLRQRQGGRT
jgi:rsbT co-antagonist protein RsbR